MSKFYTTPEHHIEILQVKEYNRRQPANYLKFTLPNSYTERVRGWVVDVANKNGVGERKRFCYNLAEAKAVLQIDYGVLA